MASARDTWAQNLGLDPPQKKVDNRSALIIGTNYIWWILYSLQMFLALKNKNLIVAGVNISYNLCQTSPVPINNAS